MSFSKRLLSGAPPPFEAGKNFKVVTYTGDGTTSQAITGVGFQPDFIWVKERSGTGSGPIADSTRGTGKAMYSNLTDLDYTFTSGEGIKSFDSDGFTVGDVSNGNAGYNGDGDTYVAWCWKAGGGSTSTNSNGSINSTVQTNADAGFSIIKYTGNGSSGATIGHNLGAVPDAFIVKRLNNSGTWNWRVYHKNMDGVSPEDYNMALNQTSAKFDRTEWNDTAPTSTVFSVDNHGSVNESGADYIGYFFKGIAGYSKFDTYIGTARDDGPIIHTGFEPAFVMVKVTTGNDDWVIFDNKRSTVNTRTNVLRPSSNGAEFTDGGNKMDFFATGFQIRGTGGQQGRMNSENDRYIYFAFAADPDENAPTLASSFNIETWRGNGSGKSVTGLGFEPGLIWGKALTAANSHSIFDTVRGINKELNSNSTDAQGSLDDGVLSFGSDGWTMGDRENLTQNNEDFVGWSWKADDNEPTLKPEVNKRINMQQGSSNYFAINETSASGKYYFEVEFTSLLGQASNYSTMMVGLYTAGYIDDWQGTRSRSYYSSTGNRYKGTTSYSYGSSFTEGDIIGVAFNGDDDEITYYKNGQSQGLAFSGNEGDSNFGIQLSTGLYGYDAKILLNAHEWNYAPPAGFEEWRSAITAYEKNDVSFNGSSFKYDNIASVVSANANAGFSIVKYTGIGADAIVPHGLSSTPELVIVKGLETTNDWSVLHKDGTDNNFLQLNGTAAESGDGSIFGSTFARPTATGFTIGDTGETGTIDKDYIAYCFHSVTGYSKIGTYEGNQTLNTDNIINFGFKPDFVMIKNLDEGGSQWMILDSKRENGKAIYGNTNAAESDYTGDILLTSQGLRFGSTNINVNKASRTYVYMAFAKNVPSNTTLANSFNAVFYAGSSTSRAISNFGFRPDLVWIKKLSATDLHVLTDSLRGDNKQLFSVQADAQSVSSTRITSFDTNGFTLDGTSSNRVNGSANSFIAWGWKAGNTWQSNFDGTQKSLVNANTGNGFSIVKWKTNGASSQTVGHGLSSTPELVIYKRLDSSQDWFVETNAIDGSYDYGNLNNNNALTTNEAGAWSTRATSTTITNFTSSNNFEYIAYCWHSVSGYSDIGVYTGNGSSTGPTITTGFKTDFVLIKRVEGAASWAMVDSLRGGGQELYANLDDADNAYTAVDFKSNGFQIVNTANGYNANGEKYLYMAFAKNATNNNTLANSFKIKTYTGNGSTQQITGIGFKPDLLWIKQRNDTNPHGLWDTTRGAGKLLVSATNAAQINNPGDLVGHFNDDGFQVNRNHGVHTAYDNTNHSSSTYVAWAWKAGNGWQSNLDGNVSSLTNANTGNGFSVVKYTANGNNNSTIGHGLSTAPSFIIIKKLGATGDWITYHQSAGADKYLFLNRSDAETSVTNIWSSVGSSTFNLISGYNDYNQSDQEYIAYCWHDVAGYSKFGTYTGNGSSSGPSVTLGFQADWILIKRTDSAEDWKIIDSERGFANTLEPNENIAEESNNNSNFTISSTGFQIGDTHGDFNANNGTYIYAAFKMN